MLNLSLLLIFAIIILLPFLIRKVEEELEIFLFVMGASAVTVSHFMGTEPAWNGHLVLEALVEPIKISVATLLFGLAFRAVREPLKRKIVGMERALGPRVFAFALIFSLGL